MRKKTFLLLLLGHICFWAMAQKELDTAEALQRQFRYEEAIPYLRKAEAFFERTHDAGQLVKTYNLRGMMDPDLNVRTAYYEKALLLLRANGDKRGVAKILTAYSEVKMQQAQLPAAEDMLKEAIQLNIEAGNGQVQWPYALLGIVQFQRKETVEALKNELASIKIGEQYGDTSSHMAETYNYAAIIYGKMGKLDESSAYLRKAIVTGSFGRDPTLTVQFRSNLANILIQQNKLKEALESLLAVEKTFGKEMKLDARIQILSRFVRCYSELGDLPGAGKYANELIKYSDSLRPDEYEQLPLLTQLNRYLIRSGQYEAAVRFVERQRLIGDKYKIPEQRLQSFYYRSQIDSANGDMGAALRNFQIYTRIKDSVNNENVNRQLNQLHVEFETEKKDKELQLEKAVSGRKSQELALNSQTLTLRQKDLLTEKQKVDLLIKQTMLQDVTGKQQQQDLIIKQKNIELLQQNNRIQEADLKTAQMVRNIIISGTLGIALMSLLVYSRYRMKKRASEEFALQREEIREKNISLQALISEKDKLLKEKEWLVKEVHHRVKNNLQMVISLLNSQSAYLSSQDAVAAIRESQRRMHAMSLIHQKLYEKDETNIDMQTYIAELVDFLKDSFDAEHVRFAIDVNPITLDISKAVPVGLILNEAITNSLKYAFPHGQAGYILVSLKSLSVCIELIVADDGVGLPADMPTDAKKSLGMSLLRGLTDQIGGMIDINGEGGVEITIRFSPATIGTSN